MSAAFATHRLILRPLRDDDAGALHAIYSDAELMTWWSHAPITDIAATRAKVADVAGHREWLTWAITLAGDDRAIGTLSAHETRPGVAEIAYALVRAHWGRGLAREAVAALVDRLFANGARRVFADTDPDNRASNRLLAALGFTLEGRLRGEWDTHIGIRDSMIWGRLATDPPPASTPTTAPPVPPRG